MPVRVRPFDTLCADDVRDLVARRAREDRTLDFKQDLTFGDSAKLDLLQDVTAMANSSGGVLIYGVEEGEGEERGMAVGIRGLAIQPDETELRVSNLLRDGIDEPILGLLHRAVRVEEDLYVYVMRIPPSANAPHMVTLRSQRPRFWLRGTVSNDPMNARQVKEVAMRASTAFERAAQIVERRRVLLRERGRRDEQRLGSTIYPLSQAVVHIVPLFPSPGGFSYAEPRILQRLREVPPLGRDTQSIEARLSLEGFYCFNRHSAPYDQRYVHFLRDGTVELQQYDVDRWRDAPGVSERYFRIVDVEAEVAGAVAEVARLTGAGLVPMPVALALSVLRVERSKLLMPQAPSVATRPIADDDVLIEPVLVSDWASESGVALRQLFDVLWQAWGYPRSLTHAERGMPDA